MAPSAPYPIPEDEEQRLRALERYGVLGTHGDEHFDRLVQLASLILETPIAAISLVADDRQWFLSGKGLPVSQTPRNVAFCAHTIAADEVMVVPDALEDERFMANPLVLEEPGVRFYAGAPLRTSTGHNIGTICAIDRKPRQPSQDQITQLKLLADLVMRELELRRLAHVCPVTGVCNRRTFLDIGEREFRRARREGHPLSLFCFDIDNFRQINNRWGHHGGDRVLAELCHLSRGFLREQDEAGRLGDGEFALLFVDLSHEEALALAESLRVAVTQMGEVQLHSDYKLHISGGLTSMGRHDTAFVEVLRRADQAMDLAKGNGRDQVATILDGL